MCFKKKMFLIKVNMEQFLPEKNENKSPNSPYQSTTYIRKKKPLNNKKIIMIGGAGLFGILFGGFIIIGLGIYQIEPNYIGFSYSTSSYLKPGIYFEFPWKEKVTIVKTKNEFDFSVSNNDSLKKFEIKSNINFYVYDFEIFVNILKTKGIKFCDESISKLQIDQILAEKNILNQISFSNFTFEKNKTFDECGILMFLKTDVKY
jgi:hypothetical protein